MVDQQYFRMGLMDLNAEFDVKRHRASSDAMIIQQTYAKTLELTRT